MLKLWLAPKVWLHGSQSSSTGGSSVEERERLGEHRLIGADHALGVDHRLRPAGRAGGEQELGDRVRADGGARALQFDAGPRGEEVGEREPIHRSRRSRAATRGIPG